MAESMGLGQATRKTKLEEKLIELAARVAAENNLELVDVEWHAPKKLVRITIMNPTTLTATIEDCVAIDRALTTPFEQSEWIPEDVVLEVSSPGIFREIKNLEQLRQVVGQRIAVTFFASKGKEIGDKVVQKHVQRGKVQGYLRGATERDMKLDVLGPKTQQQTVEFSYEWVKKVSLDPDVFSERASDSAVTVEMNSESN